MNITRLQLRKLIAETMHDEVGMPDRKTRVPNLTYDRVQHAMDILGPGVPSNAVAAYLGVEVEDVHRVINQGGSDITPDYQLESESAARLVLQHFKMDPDVSWKLAQRLSEAIFEILTPPHPSA